MSRRRAVPWLLLFAVLALVGGRGGLGTGTDSPEPGPIRGARDADAASASSDRARVTRIVDGDTVKVSVHGREDTVRYIGMDTPETKKPGSPIECYGKKATAANTRLVDGRRVRLVYDVERRDRYGRLLAYVYRAADGRFVNAALVRDGYATPLTIPPNVRYADLFRRLAREAREAGRGLWSQCGQR